MGLLIFLKVEEERIFEKRAEEEKMKVWRKAYEEKRQKEKAEEWMRGKAAVVYSLWREHNISPHTSRLMAQYLEARTSIELPAEIEVISDNTLYLKSKGKLVIEKGCDTLRDMYRYIAD